MRWVLHDPFARLPPDLRRWVRRMFWSLAAVVIAAMSLSALFALALRAAPDYRQPLEALASQTLRKPLRIGDMALGWRGGAPSLEFQQVEVLDADGRNAVLRVESLRLGFGLISLLHADPTPTRIGLEGLELSARRSAEGVWQVRGLEVFGDDASREFDPDALLARLAGFDELRFARCTLSVLDERLDRQPLSFAIESAELSQGLRGTRVALALALPEAAGGGLELKARIRGDLATRAQWNGEASLRLRGFQALPWLRLLDPALASTRIDGGDLALQAGIADGRVQSLDVTLGARSLSQGAAEPLRDLAIEARAEPQPFGWRADLRRVQMTGARGAWPATAGSLGVATVMRDGVESTEWTARLDFLRLDDLAPWLSRVGSALKSPVGDLRALEAAYTPSEPARYRARGRFENFGFSSSSVGAAGLSGDWSLDQDGGRARLNDAAATLRLPQALTTALDFTRLGAEAQWRRDNADWVVQVPRLQWDLAGSHGAGEATLRLPPSASPQLKLKAELSVADAAALKPWMPKQWGPDLRNWLTRGLRRVPLPKASLMIDGPLADFPFDTKPGRWMLDVEVKDAEVAFAPDWPVLDGVQARLAFRGNGLSISADHAGLRGLSLVKAEARFKDFNDGQLGIDAQVTGDLAGYFEVLEQSPLRPRFEGLLKRTRGRGPARLGLRLDIPLHQTDHTLARGRVALDGAELMLTDVGEPVRDIRGEVGFEPEGISAPRLEGQLFAEPLIGVITARPSGSVLSALWSPGFGAASALSARLPAALSARLLGQTDLRATLRLGGADVPSLVFDSELRGLAIDLPAPLGKPPGTATPLRAVLADDPNSGPRLTADWSGRLGADLRWSASRAAPTVQSLSLRIGAQALPFADAVPGLSLSAALPEIAVDEWARVLTSFGLGASGGFGLTRADLSAQSWRWGGYNLPEVRAIVRADGRNLVTQLEGQGAQGELNWSPERINARLHHLLLAHASSAIPEKKSDKEIQIDVNKWPVLSADIESFEVAEAGFGATRLQTRRIPGGQKLEFLTTQGGENELVAAGQWLRREGRSSAELSTRLTSSDFEGLQRAFGFSATIAAKAARVNAQTSWTPAPAGLDWQQARGDLQLEFDNGALRGIEPGVSRVLGLFNFYALPRRLTLNFGDVADKGLAFDTIRGKFALADGRAHTEDVEVKGPSLRIRMRGDVGLVARDYRQQVTVYPGLSTGFTLGAAALAGPIGAGLVFLAQQVLDQPLEKLTQINYCVTGSWDDPQVSGECK